MADDILVEVGADITEFSRGMSQAQKSLNDFTKSSKNTFDAFKQVGTTITAAGTGLALGLGAAVKTTVDFDSALRKAGAIAGATDAEFEQLKNTAITLGANTSKSATEVAVALTELAAKGFNAADAIAALPGVIAASEASGEDLALTADTVSSALNIWGLEAAEASRVADILAMSANISAADIGSLAYSLKYAGAPAAALGISLEEVAAAAGIMANAGLDGSNAGTSLRASLLRLNNPAREQEQIMEELGFSFLDSNKQAKSLSQIVGDLGKSLEGETEAQKVATLAKLVGTEAVSGFLALMEAGPEAIDATSDALRNSAGASQEAADKMKAGIGGAIEQLTGSFESASIIIGYALIPTLQAVAEFVTSLVEKFNTASPALQQFAVGFVAIATAAALVIGPLLLVIGFIPNIISGFTALGTVFGALLSPIGIFIAAIVGLGAIFALLYSEVEGFRDSVNQVFSAIFGDATSVFESIKTTITNAVQATVEFVRGLLDKFEAFWKENGAAITQNVIDAYNKTKEVISNALRAILDFIKPQLDKVRQFWDENGKQILEAVKNAFNAVKAVIEFIMPAIQYVIQYVWEAIQDIISGALDVIMGVVKVFAGIFTGDMSKLWEGIKQIFKGAIDLVVGLMSLSFVGSIRNLVVNFSKAIVGFIRGMWDDIIGFFTRSGNAIRTLTENTLTKIIGFFVNFAKNVSNKITEAKEAIQRIWTQAIDFLRNVDLVQIGKDTINGLIKGIGSMASAVWDKAKEIANGIGDTIKKVLGIASPSKVTTQFGRWVGEGLANGIKETERLNVDASKVIAEAVKKATSTVGDEVAKLRKEQAAKEKEILQKSQQDTQNILEMGASRKKGLTVREKQRLVEIEEKAAADIAKINKQYDDKILVEKQKASAAKLAEVQAYISDKKSLDQLTLVEEAEINRQSIALFKEGSVERIKAQQNYQKSLQAVNDAIASTNEQYAQRVQKINDDLKASEKALTDNYEKSLQDRTAALRGFAGLFDEIDIRVQKSGTDLLANLAGQVDAFKIWQQQIGILSNKAIDQGLLAELQQLGPKALPQLIALNELTDVQLTEYSALYAEKSRLAREQAAAELAPLKEDTALQIEALRATANEKLELVRGEWVNAIKKVTKGTKDELSSLKQIGIDAGNGLLAGLASTEAALVAKARSIAQSVAAAMQGALDINSPSRLLRDLIGKNAVLGVIEGIDSMRGALVGSAADAAKAIVPPFEKYATPSSAIGVRSSVGERTDGDTGAGNKFVQNLTFNAPTALEPSEIARKNRIASQQFALEVGIR